MIEKLTINQLQNPYRTNESILLEKINEIIYCINKNFKPNFIDKLNQHRQNIEDNLDDIDKLKIINGYEEIIEEILKECI